MRVVGRLDLLEFDPRSFGGRVAALRRLPQAATELLGEVIAWMAGRTSEDAYVALAAFDE
jgi:hypothetical protein